MFLIGGLFSSIYLIAWVLNGTQGTKFDIPELRQYIIWMMGLIVAKHGVDSGLNSPIGTPPTKTNREGVDK